MLEVLQSGPLALLQDAGRAGVARLAVPPSGAMDRGSFAQSNRIVGNPPTACAVELLLSQFAARVERDLTLAVTGAAVPVSIDGTPVGFGTALRVPAGATIMLGVPQHGLRSYLAVRGGLAPRDGAPLLDSFSTDVGSLLGPAPLARGDVLRSAEVRPAGPSRPDLAVAPVPRVSGALPAGVTLGPRDDLFDLAQLRAIGRALEWEVTSESNRVGIRLDGPALQWDSTVELPSEGIVRGAIQVTPSGQAIVFMADHPTTGGYPVIGVVDDADTDRLAQLRPGQRIRPLARRLPPLPR